MRISKDHAASIGRLMYEALRLHGRLLEAGDRLMEPIGLTSARWQVLSATGFQRKPATVAGIARFLGLARQSVQRVVNELEAARFVKLLDNPADRRARLVALTPLGRRKAAEAEALRLPWTADIAARCPDENASAAAKALVALRLALPGQK